MVGAHGGAKLLTSWTGNVRNRKELLAYNPLRRFVPTDQGPTLPYFLKVLLSPQSPTLGTQLLADGHRRRLNMYMIIDSAP